MCSSIPIWFISNHSLQSKSHFSNERKSLSHNNRHDERNKEQKATTATTTMKIQWKKKLQWKRWNKKSRKKKVCRRRRHISSQYRNVYTCIYTHNILFFVHFCSIDIPFKNFHIHRIQNIYKRAINTLRLARAYEKRESSVRSVNVFRHAVYTIYIQIICKWCICVLSVANACLCTCGNCSVNQFLWIEATERKCAWLLKKQQYCLCLYIWYSLYFFIISTYFSWFCSTFIRGNIYYHRHHYHQ